MRMIAPNNMSEICFVDIQGFKLNNKFILKEFYVLTDCKNISYHAIVDSPHPFYVLNRIHRCQVNWLTNFHHGIKWDAGDISFTQFLYDIKLLLMGKTIICKGVEKTKWIQDICSYIPIENFINCEDLNCNMRLRETFKDIDCINFCENHTGKKNKVDYVCAVNNVMKLKRWYFENQ